MPGEWMSAYGTVLLLALLPAAGNFLGGVPAEIMRVSRRTLSLASHLAAGVVLAVVGIELVPEALASERPWIPLLTFVLGGIGFILLEHLIGWVRGRFGGVEAGASGAPAQDEEAETGAGRGPFTRAWRSTSSATG